MRHIKFLKKLSFKKSKDMLDFMYTGKGWNIGWGKGEGWEVFRMHVRDVKPSRKLGSCLFGRLLVSFFLC